MATKRKGSFSGSADEQQIDPSDELLFHCLGGGNEVGRSCHIIQYKGKTVMLDAGMHPAKDGFAALPFFDDFDLSTVDILLISHFHLDHSGSLPYVLSKTNFKGRVFMTHATKAIYKWLIQDNVRVSNTSSSSDQRTSLYNEHDHLSTLPIIETIDFNTTHTINSIRITPFPAGHVLGAAMFLISIAGLNILFTGDYSREEDRHLISAEVPKGVKIDVMITESTFGISSNPPRLEREAALMKSVTSIINRGGRVLMPVFALGRAQELLLILDEYWSRHPELQKVPIYYIGNMARRCMVVYQTYIGAMNENIKRLFRQRMAEAEARGDKSVTAGPWDFRFVRSLRNLDRFEDVGGCVMLASPGMLQTGTSRELLERWAPNERNGVIMTGYSVEGTMGKQIINEPEQIPAVMSAKNAAGPSDDQKIMIQRRCTVDEISFAAHVDGVENREFIESVAAPVVILVHGEKHQMMRLKSKLLSLNVDKEVKVKVYTPANCDEVRIPFMVDKVARVVGRLAETSPPIGQDDSRLMDGVLVQNGFKLSMMASDDLREYAGLTTTMVTCKQYITLSTASIDLIRWALESTFGLIEEINSPSSEVVKGSNGDSSETQNDSVIKKGEEADEEIPSRELTTYLIMGCVFVKYNPQRREVEVEWEGNMMNDGVADAVMAVLLTVESSPAAVKRSSKNKHCHNHDAPLPNNPHSQLTPDERFMRLCMILEAQFGSEIAPIERPKLKYHGGRKERSPSAAEDPNKVDTPNIDEPEDEEELREMEELELARLQSLGIPVPGIEIKVDNHIARVWLETLEVECSYPVLRDRVRVVVERAVETVADMWNTKAGSAMPVKGIPNGSNTIKTEQVV
ncbi:Cleavage and polyadenylation specificity factor [Trichophyton interdigitale]|uniref:Endoribonuclease YSH1 n=1 Tax=Trichophyton interdigitale (strain MR816) TaxID=1215338 RepID=A0A059JJD4_TRIIM|nr:endoribonuclease ysh1 [Trichophyton interdigitale H6]KAG5205874.1 Cleavage and polyadenylation specificity factor [Trichophyton interdigitale]KAG5217385.1 Cleavage and polyadenylation specificity factor [Trichophyton interdigitale]KAG8205867.1 Cleavage and polyadenylation specificity factor [Trichophyton interdigitale]KDB27904.1 endoribonuclease ysh1 [Trichophyton interdigitale MR816]